MNQKSSLSAAQIQYLKIGPKVGSSLLASRKLQESLSRFDLENGNEGATLSNIPKLTYGNFEGTVNNFGVLLHRDFVGTTTLHQAQKFGNFAYAIDRTMEGEKDKSSDDRKGGQKKALMDDRISLKGIWEFNGNKLLVTLKSFSIESLQTNRILETLPLPYLKLIVTHVPSSKLVKSIDSSMKQEGSSLVIIDFEKLESKVSHVQNTEQRYNNSNPYLLERAGQQLVINIPQIEIYHSESDYRVQLAVDNKDILEMLDSDLDDAESIIKKYFDFQAFQNHLSSMSQEQ